MFKLRNLWLSGSLVFMFGSGVTATAQNSLSAQPTRLAALVHAYTAERALQVGPTITNPNIYISLRGGAMVSPRGAGLVGADVSLPTLSIGAGWHGRVDVDAIFKANFGGIDTIIPVTFDQLYYAPQVGSHDFYYGAGLGAVLSGPAVFDGKLILGTTLTSNISAEANIHFTEHNTLVTLLARLHI